MLRQQTHSGTAGATIAMGAGAAAPVEKCQRKDRRLIFSSRAQVKNADLVLHGFEAESSVHLTRECAHILIEWTVKIERPKRMHVLTCTVPAKLTRAKNSRCPVAIHCVASQSTRLSIDISRNYNNHHQLSFIILVISDGESTSIRTETG